MRTALAAILATSLATGGGTAAHAASGAPEVVFTSDRGVVREAPSGPPPCAMPKPAALPAAQPRPCPTFLINGGPALPFTSGTIITLTTSEPVPPPAITLHPADGSMGTEAGVEVLVPSTFRFAPLTGASTYALFTLPYEDDDYTGTQRYLVNLQEMAVTPPAEGTPGWLAPSKLRVRRARIVSASRTLDLLAPVSRLVEGSATVRLHAAGRTTRFEAPVRAARSEGLAAIRLKARIPVSQAALGTGIVTIDVPGIKTVRETTVRLRAASKRADLRVARIALDHAKGLSASGTIARQARGVVRIDVSYQDLKGVPRIWRAKARIHDGHWNLSADKIPASVRASGGSFSVAYTGRYANRIRGEILTYRISPGASRRP